MTDQEINEAVARELGWKPRNYDPLSLDPITRIPCFTAPNGDLYDHLPDFCHSIQAAWEIVEHLYKNHPTWVFCLRAWPKCVRAEWVLDLIERYAEADTAPRAICLAFLKLE